MELRFALSGSVIATAQADCVPEVGSEVVIRTDSYKKGVTPGSLLRFPVSAEFPPVSDYSEGNRAVVYIAVNEYQVLEEGPPVD